MDMIFHAIMQATLVSKLVLALLLFMSLVSWAYMLGKWLCLRKVRTHVLHGLDVMDSDDLLESLAELERYGSSPLYGITRRGVREFNRISRTGDAERLMNDNVRRALHFGIAHEMALLRSSLSLLARGRLAPKPKWKACFSFCLFILLPPIEMCHSFLLVSSRTTPSDFEWMNKYSDLTRENQAFRSISVCYNIFRRNKL